jgi:hypothetical protein
MKADKKKCEKMLDKNVTWNNNHVLIMEAFDKIYDETGKYPSNQKIADETGLHLNTIIKHSESLTLEKITPRYKLAGERVLKSVIKKIEETGNAAEVKIYNQIVFGYREENKTIHEFSEAEAKEKIENLFLK